MCDEGFDTGGDIGGGDISSDIGSDLGSDVSGDLGGDLAGDDGVDLSDATDLSGDTYGGENIAENITPLHALEHFDKKGVHAPDSPFGKMGGK